jgi:hypothetical protein
VSEPETPEVQTLAVPLNPDGTIGTLPDPLQKLVDARIREATQRAKAKTPDPVELERLKTLEAENEQFRIKDAEAGKRYEEAIAIRETREQAERARLQTELDRRTERLTRAARTEIKAEALRLGAREESLDELVELLGTRVTLNDDLDVVVKGADSIAAMVAGYLDTKPHHRKAAGGQSMGTTGGVMTQTGGVASTNKVAEIQARVRRQGRATAQDIQDLREAQAAS